MIFGRRPIGFLETTISLGGELFFSGLLGVMFAFLIPQIRSSNILLKSWIFGVGTWFGIYAVMTLFQVKGLEAIESLTALADVISSSIYGLLLGYILTWLDRRARVK